MRILPFLLLLPWLAGCVPLGDKPGDSGAPVDADGDGFLSDAECDDTDASVFPGASEVCDGHDDDCDGEVDEGVIQTFWVDADADGYGAGADTVLACEAPPGQAANGDDCDDANAAIHPAATEACDGVDENCDGVPDTDYNAWYTDADADGYGDPLTAVETCTPEAGLVPDGTDCDDADAGVNPGAAEVCDRDDDNCDGRADLGEVSVWHTDTDGDGYGHIYTFESTCDPDPSWVLDGSDCRPGDPEAFPGAPERCNDDDDDCDMEVDEDFELDADGHLSTACGGDDCDDTDAATFPGAVEVCDDGRDNDCDGADSRCGYGGTEELASADAKIYSDAANFDAGRVVDVGDIDADGFDDLVVATMYADGYNGGAYVLYGPIHGDRSLDDAGYRISGSRRTYAAGRSIGVGDVNGDGFDDVAVGAPDGTDKEWIMFGPITGNVELLASEIVYEGVTNSEAGHGSDLADVNGDGVDDAIIGAYEDATGGYAAGSIFIDYGPISAGTYDLRADTDAQLIGDIPSAYAGRYIRAGEDVDGDGLGDILAAAPYASLAGPYSGAAYVVYGGVTGDLDLASADGILHGEGPGDYAGEELALGDVDGDGLADVILGSYNARGGSYAGAAYVVLGPASGTTELSGADVIIRGDSAGQYVGLGLAVSDLDDDGAGDLLLAATGDATSGSASGSVYLFYGALSGTVTLADAGALYLGEAAADDVGQGLVIGDFDGDGAGDLAIGAPGERTGGSQGGAVYVKYPNE
ncbi:MAG: MopE-related protein [Pseudomonadota bacterium]|nr:MopE-related protein [Pseudomonadota bacterium]